MSINSNIFFRKSDSLEVEEIDTGYFLSSDGRRWVKVERTALAVWNSLEEPASIGDLVTELLGKYDGEPERIRSDVSALLMTWTELGLVATQ
ncbi:PqqD family protein [Parafrankia elaeagni]|uniref:PqqD family protein n=1 Tax=Parafrankia elaeagni TaxID=222534 RepID=UPI00036BA4ED|nr:PqqD family protein [Parafrankia elaeagni]